MWHNLKSTPTVTQGQLSQGSLLDRLKAYNTKVPNSSSTPGLRFPITVVSVRCNCQLGKWILVVTLFLSLDSARSFSQTAQENIDLQTTILSRFDLIFIVKDERNHEKDMVRIRARKR
jgi:hypothetical protein